MSEIQPPRPEPMPDGPETLDSTSGTAVGAEPRRGGRKGLLVGGGVVALALAGGGAWAAMSFLGTGAQPAEALPAGTLGYASIDLDPSGGQKIEAVRTLNKFPAFEDKIGISPDDDLRRSLFEAVQDGGTCPDLDYADDIEPWLGDRAALAGVLDAAGDPQPVVVLQVSDADAADAGLQAIRDCSESGSAGASSDETGWVVEGDWAVVAPTEDVARTVVDEAARASLADDATYQEWTEATGDAGVVTMYAAPEAAEVFVDQLGEEAALPESSREQLTDFRGAAATIRFADGTLELEAASGLPQTAGIGQGESVSGSVGSLPDDTAAVVGVGLGEGWVQTLLDQFSAGLGGQGSAEDLLAQFEQVSGLSLPDDLETLTRGGLVLSVGPGIDPEALANATDPTQVPVALKLSGDAGEIEQVVQTITGRVPEVAPFLATTADGDTVVVGPDETYRQALADGGALGDSDRFGSVVTSTDSPFVLYLDVDAFDDAVSSLAGGDQQVVDNIRPLSAIGISSSLEDDVSRVVLRIGTDEQ